MPKLLIILINNFVYLHEVVEYLGVVMVLLCTLSITDSKESNNLQKGHFSQCKLIKQANIFKIQRVK